jgi:hypothetical protein
MKNILLFRKSNALLFWSFTFLLLFSFTGHSQISIASTTPVTENFTIGTTATASLPANWKMSAAGAGSSTLSYTASGNLTATSQAANSGTPATGGRFNWGDSTNTTDRAIGFMTSGSYASPNAIQAFYRNTSGSQINDITIAFDFERYRINSAAASVTFFTSTNGTSWTSRTAGDIATSAFPTGTNSYTFTGGTTVNRSVTLSGVNIAAGGDFYVMWLVNTTGGNSQGIGLDNVSLTATIVSLTAPTLTLSDETKTYGDGTFTMTAGSNSGGAITYSSNNTAVATINSNSGLVTIVGAGSTTITASQAANGTFSAGSTTATITVSKAAGITITANGVSKVYGTTLNNGSSTAISVSGLQYTDTLGTNPSATITYGLGGAATDSATLATVSPAVYTGTAVPTALVAGTGATYNANNYNAPSFISGNITVSKVNQSINFASTDSKAYGTADYAPGATSATSGANAITYSTNGTTVATIVSGNIQIVGVGTALVTAAQAGDDNYTAATSVTQTLTVTAKGLTISGLSASNKNFDGNTDATITGTPSLDGIVGTDDVSLIGTAVGTFATSAVGTGIAVTVTGYSLNGTTASNYTLTQPTLSADIIANTPTLFTSGTLASVNTIYGLASATPSSFNVNAQSLTDVITIAAPTGFEVSTSSASGYASSITVGGAGSLSSTPIYVRLNSTNAVGTYSGNITLNSPDAVQVTIATASSSVAPKELSITGLIGVDKTYDTTTTATVTGTPSLVGVVGSDEVTLNSSSVTYNFANANAGIAKPIIVLGYTLDGTSASNYTVAQPTGITATINKTASSISVTGSSTFTYNATAQGPTTSNVLGSTGTVTYSYNGVSPTVYGPSSTRPTNAGEYTVAATVLADTNFEAATSADYGFSIAKADQTITLAATDSRITASVPYTLALNASSGLPVTYQSSNGSVATLSGNTVTITGAGTTTITAIQAGDSNYNAATAATQTLTVIQAPIVLAGWDFTGVGTTSIATLAATTFNSGLIATSGANNITRGAGAAWSTGGNSFRTAGFQNNGIATTNTDFFQTTLTATTGRTISLSTISANLVGTGTFAATPGVSSQFAYSTNGTTFTLIGSPTVTVGTPASLSIDVSGISALQNVAAGTTITFRYYASGQTTTGGWGFASASSGTNGLAFSGFVNILADPTLTLSDETKTYGDGTFTMTAGSNSGGAITYSSNNTAVATINSNSGLVTIVGAGSTTITASQAANGTFSAGSTTATITVSKAAGITITANGVSKVYGTTLNNGSSTAISVSGLQYSDTLGTNPSATITYGLGGTATDSATLATVSPAVYAGTAVPTDLVAGTGATYNANNYNAPSFISGNITVSKADQSITFASTDSKVYGTADYVGATSATSGTNAITYSTNGATVVIISSGNIQIVGVGIAFVTAAQAGDDNYNAATPVTQTLMVTAKELTISGLSASNKNFDGNTDATITGTPSLDGIVGGDGVALSGTAVGTFATSAVGTSIAVTVTGYSLNGMNAGNYTLTQPTLSADIIANTPTLFTSGTLASVNTIYGSASATPSSFNVNAQSLTDVITIAAPTGFEVSTSSASGYASSITVGGAGSVSSTPIYVRLNSTNAVGTYSGNITLNSPDAVQVTIATASSSVAPKELSITGLIGVDKTYDTTTTATVTGTPSLVGVVGSDEVTLNSSSVTYNFANANAGIAKPIIVLGYTLDGTSASNYTVAQPTGITATINKAASSISVTGSSTFTYNTTAQGPTTSNVLGSTGTVTYSYNGVSPTVYGPSSTRPTNAGEYTVAATVLADTNFEAATSADYGFSIAKAEQTIALASTDIKAMGAAAYTLAATTDAGLTITYTYTPADNSVISITGNTVTIIGSGTATIAANQSGNDNYNAATQVQQTLTVTLPACATTSGTTSWNFATASPSTTQANLTVSAITRANDVAPGTVSALITSTSGSSGYSGSSGTNNAGVAAVAGVLDPNTSSYFAFTVTPAMGYNFTLNGISFGSRVTSSGPVAYSLRSSVDNYATTLATGTLNNDSVWRLLTNTGLSVSGQGNANPVTFRLYGHNSVATPGTAANWRIDDLVLTVGLSNAPSAASVASNLSVCGLTSAPLGGNTPNVGTGTWSQVSGPGTSTFSAVNSGSSTATVSELGTYVYRWSISNGCATTNTADVTVVYTAATSNTTTATACDTYTWSLNGQTYTTSGTRSLVTGCFTEFLDLTINVSTSNTTNATACDTYTWSVNNNVYTTGGNYTITSTNAAGCPNTETLNLTINASTSNTTTATACDTYTWSVNGVTYTTGGTYTGTSTNAANCPQAETLILTINASTSNTTTATACDTYTWSINGATYTTSGQRTVTSTNAANCPQTETLNLTINASTSNTTTATACDTYTWSVNGATYTTSGQRTTTSTNSANCPQTETLNLTITPSTTGTATISACDTYTWSAGNGVTYTSTPNVAPTFVSGCHIQTLNLTITPSTINTTEITACESYYWPVTELTYTDSDEITETVGCVTETLVLTINYSTSNTTTITQCDGSYTWEGPLGNDETYTESTTVTNVTTNAEGCDHIETLVLTINNSTSSVETITSPTCGTYTWSENSTTYTSSGTYTSTSTNAAGCPNTKTLVLTINPCESVVAIKMNIQGYYDADAHAMRAVMANQGVSGASATDVDDVTVELRDSITNALVVSTTARLKTDGTATATFVTAPSGSFYIAVKHRNSLETWSATAQTVGATPLTYDFTTAANKAYGNNMIQLESGVYGFYSGDLNQDGFIESGDYPSLYNDSDAGLEGYYSTDLNGDGFVESGDYPILFNNSDSGIEISRP